MVCECGCGQTANPTRRFIVGHARRKKTADGFWLRVQKTPTCWVWLGCKDKLGYGSLSFRGIRKSAHRFAYELLRGAVPPGRELDHLCRNPSCVNPNHLDPVTHQENIKRGNMLGAANIKKTRCPQGHPYDRSNTYIDKRGFRYCRECGRASCRRYYHARNSRMLASTISRQGG